MNLKTKSKRNFKKVLLLLIIVGATSLLNILQPQLILSNRNNAYEKPKASNFWVMGPLHIKDSPGPGGDYTWAEAVLQEWCSGDGSLNTPYLLENITIDAGGSESGILIEDSNGKYFTIRNCTVMNSGTNLMANAGIKLLSSSNGTVVENNCLNNVKSGIMLEFGNYNFITDNYIYNSSGVGVRIYQSVHNEVLGNNITEGGTNSEGIMIDTYSEFNVISDNDVSNQFTGIRIAAAAASNNTIFNNWLFNNSHIGINISPGCNNNTIELNEIQNSSYGLRISGDGNAFYRNILINNTQNAEDWGNYNQWDNGSIGNFWDDYGGVDADDDGIGDTPYDIDFGANPDNFPIWDDGFDGSKIHIDDTGVNSFDWAWASEMTSWCTGEGTLSNPYVIKDIAIDAGAVGSPIFIESSNVYFIIENCNLTNSQATGNDAGIKFEDVYNAKIIDNNISDNYAGVKLIRSDNNTISSNDISDNTGQGIVLQQSEENLIEGNTANNSLYYGLLITSLSHNNTVEGNIFGNNKGASGYGSGIRIDDSNDNEISSNQLNDNDQGIKIVDNSDDNEVFDNTIHNNEKYGILIIKDTRLCVDNIVYGNNINNPLGVNAYDNGTGTEWDYLGQGNYWGDYPGVDDNDDGIGDNPYYFSGTGTCVDNFPLWDDGLNPSPVIILNSPQPFSARTFGTTAPTINITITDNDLVTAWYTIDYGTTKYDFKPEIGINIITINQTAWSALDEGSVTIAFFANDTQGQESNLNILFTKEIPSSSPGIPFGNYHILFVGIGIISLLVIVSRKRKLINS